MLSSGIIRIRISDPRSLWSWYIWRNDKSSPTVDSTVRFLCNDPSDLGSLIPIRSQIMVVLLTMWQFTWVADQIPRHRTNGPAVYCSFYGDGHFAHCLLKWRYFLAFSGERSTKRSWSARHARGGKVRKKLPLSRVSRAPRLLRALKRRKKPLVMQARWVMKEDGMTRNTKAQPV